MFITKEFLNFLKWIGIIPEFNNLLLSLIQMFIICGVGFIFIYLICEQINNKILKIKDLVDKEVTEYEKKFLKKLFLKYPLWGFVQQLIMVIIFYYVRKLFNSDWISITVTSLIFVLFHFPNLYLSLAVFGLEQLLLNYFLLYHNLYFISFIHGFLGTALLYFSPSIVYTRFTIFKNYWELYKE